MPCHQLSFSWLGLRVLRVGEHVFKLYAYSPTPPTNIIESHCSSTVCQSIVFLEKQECKGGTGYSDTTGNFADSREKLRCIVSK
ncbi:unnamed protein product [Albugo candida]|uniref:Uncharacterized protein n=1 Tax=Albugo candida TaxID=65357 RepID=A0A024FWQ8_9STRA|nr:unnamed protein product [Albugo candida]|eukprot:CCI11084.1 unnamed protein product [Albugo candida]